MSAFTKLYDYVTESQNSKVWPSNDPDDCPYNTFTCKLCGWRFDVRIYGAFPAGYDPYDDVRSIITEHLVLRH